MAILPATIESLRNPQAKGCLIWSCYSVEHGLYKAGIFKNVEMDPTGISTDNVVFANWWNEGTRSWTTELYFRHIYRCYWIPPGFPDKCSPSPEELFDLSNFEDVRVKTLGFLQYLTTDMGIRKTPSRFLRGIDI